MSQKAMTEVFLARIYKELEDDYADDEDILGYIVDWFDRRCCSGDLGAIALALDTVDIGQLLPVMSLAFAQATLPIAGKLGDSRVQYLRRLRETLTSSMPERVDALLQGLDGPARSR